MYPQQFDIAQQIQFYNDQFLETSTSGFGGAQTLNDAFNPGPMTPINSKKNSYNESGQEKLSSSNKRPPLPANQSA